MTKAGDGWDYLVLTEKELTALPEYSHSVPTGTTIGKRWRRLTVEKTWIVGEYQQDPDPNFVIIKWYKTRRPEQWFKTGLDIVLHPDVTVRDPYGVITREQIQHYARMTEGFVDGWLTHAVQTDEVACESAHLPEYWIVKDYVGGIADIPDYVVCQIAMHYCRPFAQRPWGHRTMSPFHAVP